MIEVILIVSCLTCNILLYFAVYCYILLYFAILYYTLLYLAISCYTLVYFAILCHTWLYLAIHGYHLQYFAILCFTLLYFAIYYAIFCYICYNLRFESTPCHFYLNSSKILISDFPILISDFLPPATDQVLGSCDQKVKVVNNFDFLNKVYKQSCKKLMLGTSDA